MRMIRSAGTRAGLLAALLTALLAALLAVTGCSSGGPAVPSPSPSRSGSGTIVVTSAAFDDGGPIPIQFTCDGDGASPPLQWSGVPDAAQSVAVVVDDPDAPSGAFTHWVLAGLPGGDGGLEEDAGAAGDGVSALNSGGRPGWTPPCPPSGLHHYRFTVYALSGGAPFAAGTAAAVALSAISAAAVARGTLTGTYTRPG